MQSYKASVVAKFTVQYLLKSWLAKIYHVNVEILGENKILNSK